MKYFFVLSLFIVLLSGFVYFQTDNVILKLESANELFTADYIRLTGINERLKTLQKYSLINTSEYEKEIIALKNQLVDIKNKSEERFSEIEKVIRKKTKDSFKPLYWLAMRKLNSNYMAINNLYNKCLVLFEKEEKLRKEKIKQEKNEFINKILSYFKNKRELKIISLVDDEYKYIQKNKKADNVKRVEIKDEKMVRKNNNKINNNKTIQKVSNKSINENTIEYLKDLSDIDNAELIFEIANKNGELEYIVISNNEVKISENISNKKYLEVRIKDALNGKMFDLVHQANENTNSDKLTFQEIQWGDVRYFYNPKTLKYIRKIGNKKEYQIKNIIFQFVKSEKDNAKFSPDVLGFGDVLAFSNGKIIKGVWLKEDYNTPLKFYDTTGKPLSLIKGPTLVEVLPEEINVKYRNF